jgi:hypothetical protein
MLRRCLIAIWLACGCLPPDKPENPATPADPDVAALVHAWVVENHIVTSNSTLGESDAMRMHGRKVEITATGYRSPFEGTCDEASRAKRVRSFEQVGYELDLAGEGRHTAERFGMTKQVTEFKLTCANKRTPTLLIYVAGARALTCFSGVCYLLTPS